MDHVIAADIGGSKTLLRVYAPDGCIVKERTGIGVGLAEDSTEDLPELRQLLCEIAAEADIAAIAVNLGGKNREQLRAVFRGVFGDTPIDIFRESEGTAALALGRSLGAEIVLLAGTGTIAVAKAEGGTIIAGGWGANIGDDGSGYAIGLEAIRRSLAELDSGNPLSLLAQTITGLGEAPGVLDAGAYCRLRDAVRQRLAPLDRRNIASYTKIVGALADQGEPVSREILREAGTALGRLAAGIGRKRGTDAPVSIALTGGLLHTAAHWKPSFEAYLAGHLPTDRIHYAADGLIAGVYEMARQRKEGSQFYE